MQIIVFFFFKNFKTLMQMHIKLSVERVLTGGIANQHTQSTQLMRVLLKRRIHDLKFEDKEWMEHIRRHGMNSIPDEDLQDLSRDRGMRALGLTRGRLERQYLDWVELATDPSISVCTLLYNRHVFQHHICYRIQCWLIHGCYICLKRLIKWAKPWRLLLRKKCKNR